MEDTKGGASVEPFGKRRDEYEKGDRSRKKRNIRTTFGEKEALVALPEIVVSEVLLFVQKG